MKAPLSMLLALGALSLGGVVVLKSAHAAQPSTFDTTAELGGKDGGGWTTLAGKDGGVVELTGKDGGVVELTGKDGGVVELAMGKDGGRSVVHAGKDGGSIELTVGGDK